MSVGCHLLLDNGLVIVENKRVILIGYLGSLQQFFALRCQAFQTSLSKLFDCVFIWCCDIFKAPISQCFILFRNFDDVG